MAMATNLLIIKKWFLSGFETLLHSDLHSLSDVSTVFQRNGRAADRKMGSGEWGMGNGEVISRSPLPIPHSPFPTPHSPFPTPHSPFPTPHSPFPTPYSLFSCLTFS